MVAQSHVELCKYYTYKIFHFIHVFHKVALNSFVAEFAENDKGDWVFYDAKIYRLASIKQDVKSQAAREEVVKPAESELGKLEAMHEDVSGFLSASKPKQQATFGLEKRREDEAFEQQLEVIARMRESDVLGLNFSRNLSQMQKASPNKKLRLYLTLRQTMDGQMSAVKSIVGDQQAKSEILKVKEDNDYIYAQLNPSVDQKLSKIVMEEGYSFDKMYKKYSVPDVPASPLNTTRRMTGNLTFVSSAAHNQTKLGDRANRAGRPIDRRGHLHTDLTLFDHQTARVDGSLVGDTNRTLFREKAGDSNSRRTHLPTSGRDDYASKSELPSVEKRKRKTNFSLLDDLSNLYTDRLPMDLTASVNRERNRSEIIRRKHLIMEYQSKDVKNIKSRALKVNSVQKAVELGAGVKQISEVNKIMRQHNLDPRVWCWKPQHKEFSALDGISQVQKLQKDRSLFRTNQKNKPLKQVSQQPAGSSVNKSKNSTFATEFIL